MSSKHVIAALAVLLLVAAAVVPASAAVAVNGYKAGCVFTVTLEPYTGSNYKVAAIFANNWTQSLWNSPFLLFNGKSSTYTFDVPVSTAGAGVLGQLPDNTNLVGLTNTDAFTKAKSFARYHAQYHTGATYYGFASQGYSGSIQFAFQVKKNLSGKNIELDVAIFVANSNYNPMKCVESQREVKISGKCSQNRWIRFFNDYCTSV